MQIDGKTFVITGKLSRVRSEFTKAILSLGGYVSSYVTSSTDYLVLGQAPGQIKLSAAISNNVPALTEEQLSAMISEDLKEMSGILFEDVNEVVPKKKLRNISFDMDE